MKRLITTFLFLAATSGLTAEVVEDFNGYSDGVSSDAFYGNGGSHGDEDNYLPTGPWYKWIGSAVDKTSTVDIASDKFLRFGYDNEDRGAYRDLGSSNEIGDDATGSFKFSFYVLYHNLTSGKNKYNDLYYGIGHESSPENVINSFVAGINLQHDSSNNKLKLRAFNGSVMTDLPDTYEYNTWYHAALSIDRTATTDTYSVYVVEVSGSNVRTPPASHVDYSAAVLSGISFNADSNTEDKSLSTFMVLADDIGANKHAYLDNVGYSTDLIPEVDNFALLIGLGLLTACITNRKLSVRP